MKGDRIVIMQNDYPAFVMPEGTPIEGIQAFTKRLEENDPNNITHRKRYPWETSVAVHYHWHKVPEYKAP